MAMRFDLFQGRPGRGKLRGRTFTAARCKLAVFLVMDRVRRSDTGIVGM